MVDYDILSDENWSTTVEFEIELWEQAQYVGWQDENVGLVEIAVRYPDEAHYLQVPFFPMLFGDNTYLERIVIRSGRREPRIGAIYSDQTVVIRRASSDTIDHRSYNYWQRQQGQESDEVLWDAFDQDTTDPLRDITLGDDALDEANARSRDWLTR